MEYSWNADATVCPEDYTDEKLSALEKEELWSYERGFQRLVAQILDAHSEEIKEYIAECLVYIREKYPQEDEEEEENSQTSESEED